MITHDDTIGIIYQSLLSEGSKSRHGAYYTPKIMVEKIFNEYCSKNSKFLDPCCGTGEFLICAARSGYYDPESLYGYDIDALAVKIARFNLLLTFREKEFSPNIYKADTLTEIASGAMFCETNDLKNTFDLIATNPPWGSAVKDCNLCKKMYPQITSRESFSLFLSKAMILAKRRGYISFILPESVLNIKAHSDIRKHLLENTTIKAVHALGRRFKGVFTPVIRLDLINEKAFDGSTLDVVRENGNSYKIPQSRFKDNDNFIFDVSVSNEEHKILSFIYEKPYVTLKDNAEWAMGIVTGDNRKFITDKQSSGSEPVYKGSDVNKFFLKSPKSYIKYEPELFQQTAPEYIYRAGEKLIYKFISDRLIFAYDRNKSLTLNSANILIPKLDGYPIKLVLGLLNSGIYQFIFSRKFNTHKVLKGDLEKLPLPLIKNEDQNQIISLVEEAINGKDVCRELDSAIMRIIGLSQDQMAVIRDMS